MTTTTATRPATKPQVEFIKDMLAEIAKAPETFLVDGKKAVDDFITQATTWTFADGEPDRVKASQAIDRLKAVRSQVRAAAATKPAITAHPASQLEPGRYAVTDDTGVTKFFRVKAGTKNPAYRFIDVQASDTFYPVRGKATVVIAKAILTDVAGARMLYANELGRCYQCGRTLTDETSRTLGIGPVCRGDA